VLPEVPKKISKPQELMYRKTAIKEIQIRNWFLDIFFKHRLSDDTNHIDARLIV
jgi:hypothetical protein